MNIIRQINEALSEPNHIRYEFDYYPREDQQLGKNVIIEDGFKNHDDLNTWGGVLVGSREDVAATLAAWGQPVLSMTHTSLTPEDAAVYIEEGAEEVEPGVFHYEFGPIKRNDQRAAEGCAIEDAYKNYDANDTWGGTLIGTKEAIIETLSQWGNDRETLEMRPLTMEDALILIDEGEED